jgi:dipeptidase E
MGREPPLFPEMLPLPEPCPRPWANTEGLGFLKGSACPHYDESDRKSAFRESVATAMVLAGIGVGAFVGVHYLNGRFVEAISSKPDQLASYVSASGNRAADEPIRVRDLSES